MYLADLDAFNSRIGFITNCSTTMYEMITQYEEGSREYNELLYRLMYSRRLQGDEIDRAKGVEVDPFPKHWTDYKECDNDFDKSLVIDKRPYFMRYIYPDYDRKYKTHIDKMENYSQTKFKCSHKDCDDEEFVDLLYGNSPLLHTDGTMNRVCRYMESKVEEISRNERITPSEICEIIIPNGEYVEEFSEIVNTIFEKYKDSRAKMKESNTDYSRDNFVKYCEHIKSEIVNIGDIRDVLYTAIKDVYVGKATVNKDFIWDILGEYIVMFMIQENNYKNIYIPVKDNDGEIEYLYDRYTKREVLLNDNI